MKYINIEYQLEQTDYHYKKKAQTDIHTVHWSTYKNNIHTVHLKLHFEATISV